MLTFQQYQQQHIVERAGVRRAAAIGALAATGLGSAIANRTEPDMRAVERMQQQQQQNLQKIVRQSRTPLIAINTTPPAATQPRNKPRFDWNILRYGLIPVRVGQRRRPAPGSQQVSEANTPGRQQYVLNRRAVRGARHTQKIAQIGTTIDPQQKDPVKVLSSVLRLQSPDLQILMRPTLDPKLAQNRRERKIPQSAMLLDRTRGARSKPADPHPTRTRRPRQHKSSGIRPEPYG